MGVGVAEGVGFEDGPDELSVAFEQLVEHLAVVYVVAPSRSRARQRSRQELHFRYWLKVYRLVECIQGCRVKILSQVVQTLLQVPVTLEEILLRSARSVIR